MKTSTKQDQKQTRDKNSENYLKQKAAKKSDFFPKSQIFPLFNEAEDLISEFIGKISSNLPDHNASFKSYVCELKKKQNLSLKRDGIEYLYLILEGHLKVSMGSSFQESKGDNVFIAWRSPRQIIGEMSPISGQTQPLIIEALTNCKLIEIPTHLFIKIADENPKLYRNMVKLLIEKTFEERRRADLIQSVDEGVNKVAYTILMFYNTRGGSVNKNTGCITINGLVRHEDIAGHLGWSRQNVKPYLDELKGVVAGGKGGKTTPEMKIYNIEKLRDIAAKLKNEDN